MNEIPAILRADLYASAALAGAIVVVIAKRLQLSPIAGAITGGALCFALRFAALRYGWHLPAARSAEQSGAESDVED
ncbi:MAG TPA: hypothetical protein VFN67_35185 [Polyangiales bacterium]|nr:hypothetical protein [Polyangiales bacterium]